MMFLIYLLKIKYNNVDLFYMTSMPMENAQIVCIGAHLKRST